MKQDRGALRYLPWLARDVAVGPGLLYVVVSIVVCVVLWRVSRATGSPSMLTPELIQSQAFNIVMLVMCLVATGGMVSGDLHGGFYRAFFSKPMPTWWYYLQRWLLGAVAVLLTPLVFGFGLDIVFGKGFGVTRDLMVTIALGYLLIAGSVFLLSVFTRRDWLLVFLIVTAQRMIASLVTMNVPIPRVIKVVWQALPPFHLIAPGKLVLHGTALIHVVAYGLAMVVVALVLLRVRPLGSGGRA